MLRAFGPGCDGQPIDPATTDLPPGATWIDLHAPSQDEEMLVEQALGLDIPTREELVEIEPSSRLYDKDGALYMTMSLLCGVRAKHPTITPIGFVLARDRLVTVRYETPRPVQTFADQVLREPELARDPVTVLLRLLDAIVERLADELEASGDEIERIGHHIFGREPGQQRIPSQRLEALLLRIGRAEMLLSRIRETAVSAGRLLGFLIASDRIRDDVAHRERVRSLAADVQSLTEHSGFLAGNLSFLLNASLGLISVEQNAAIKVFSVAAVVLLPPALVAGVYGMNFDHMPELDWLIGYPWALGLMLLSAILPYWWFRRRGWL